MNEHFFDVYGKLLGDPLTLFKDCFVVSWGFGAFLTDDTTFSIQTWKKGENNLIAVTRNLANPEEYEIDTQNDELKTSMTRIGLTLAHSRYMVKV